MKLRAFAAFFLLAAISFCNSVLAVSGDEYELFDQRPDWSCEDEGSITLGAFTFKDGKYRSRVTAPGTISALEVVFTDGQPKASLPVSGIEQVKTLAAWNEEKNQMDVTVKVGWSGGGCALYFSARPRAGQNAAVTDASNLTAGAKPLADMLSYSETLCSDLGFAANSTDHAACVVKLLKMQK